MMSRALLHPLFDLASHVALAGIFALVAARFGPTIDRWLRERHARQLAARLARGEDRYFEELRTLQADAPRAPYIRHSFGWWFVRFLAFFLALAALDYLFDFLFSFFPE